MNDSPRRFILCADDYGISPGVNHGICELISLGRLNATSVMMLGPASTPDQINELKSVAKDCAIGLHVTLTAPFHPLTMLFRPLADGMLLPLLKLLRLSLLRRLDAELIQSEILTQLNAFKESFGRAPDFVDGHQHVQLFPQIRDAFIDAVKHGAPAAWVRQGGSQETLLHQLRLPKAFLLDVLSTSFRKRALRAGLRFNPSFAGAYDFDRQSDFKTLMSGFLKGLPDGGLVMCHPGYVDDILVSLDSLTHQREIELAFLMSDEFPRTMNETGSSLMKMNEMTCVLSQTQN